jgi:methylase of polypeptide subunit release factors
MSCWAQNLEFQKSLDYSRMESGTDELEFEEEIALLVKANKKMKVNTICQTGFNTGISAFAFLCALPHVHVHSFDIGAHFPTYQSTIKP